MVSFLYKSASHFYDSETGKNAIFKKQTTEFVSAWKLTEGQVDDLLTNGNVGDYSMEYDKIRYLELLKQAESLEKKGMSLYREDQDRYLELLKYQVRLSDQKFWENRKNYFSVMNNLINEKLTAEDFIDEFLCLWEKDRDRLTVNCDPNIGSKGFAKWMDKIFSRCEVFEPEAQKNEEYGEKWLKDSVSNVLIQIQKEYNSNENAN